MATWRDREFLRCFVDLGSDYEQFHYTINDYTTVLRIRDLYMYVYVVKDVTHWQRQRKLNISTIA